MLPHDSIVEGVRHGAALLYRERNADRGCPWRASAIGGCQRKLALLARPDSDPLPTSARSALTLDHGTIRGAELARAFMRATQDKAGPLAGWSVDGLEVPVYVPLPMPGSPDGAWDPALLEAARSRWPELRITNDCVYLRGRIDLLARRPDGCVHLIDFKTAHSFSYKQQKASEDFDESYLAQLGFYILGLDHERFPDIGDPLLVYECKDDHEMFAKVCSADEARAAALPALHDSARAMLATLTGGPLPWRPFGPNAKGELPWQCRYCPVYRACWATSIVQVTGDPLLPKSIVVRPVAHNEDPASYRGDLDQWGSIQ